MDETVITWNFENWVTITIMVVVGFAVIGAIGAFARRQRTTE